MTKFKKYLSLTLKIFLTIAILDSLIDKFYHIAFANFLILILLFLPDLMKKSYKIKIPEDYETFFFIFLLFTFFLKFIRIEIAPLIFGLTISFMNFLIILSLYSLDKKKNAFPIILISFSLTVTLGFLLEFIKYYLKILLGEKITVAIYSFSMWTMTYVILGAVISGILGFLYIKTNEGILRKIMKKIIRINPNLKFSNSKKEIIELIKEGESEKQEFKSTLRVNLHTSEFDSKIEHSALKTISAFLNSKGGSLIIGVTDKGKIIGIEKDRFENTDKFFLHLTNLIRERLSKKDLIQISFEKIDLQKKVIIRINCKTSKKPVFLKNKSGEEEFYIRAGPSSIKLQGKEFLGYVNTRFKNQ